MALTKPFILKQSTPGDSDIVLSPTQLVPSGSLSPTTEAAPQAMWVSTNPDAARHICLSQLGLPDEPGGVKATETFFMVLEVPSPTGSANVLLCPLPILTTATFLLHLQMVERKTSLLSEVSS